LADDFTDLTPGTLLEVEHAGKRVVAAVSGVDRSLVSVVTEVGEDLSLAFSKVLFASSHRLGEQEVTPDRLRRLGEAIEAERREFELATIWELLRVEGMDDGLADEDIAELWYGECDAAQYFATRAVLRDDTVYFKHKNQRYWPRRQRDVQTALEQQRKTSARESQRDAFIDTATRILSGKAEPSALEAIEGVQVHLDRLLDYAAHGDFSDDKERATELLDSLNERPGQRFSRAPWGAFRVLLGLGRVERHENLSLHRHRIRTTFDPELVALAERLAAKSPPGPLAGAPPSSDEVPVLTIDDATTRDFDDALSVAPRPDGSVEVGIHVTDVGSLLEPESPLDLEARRRGSSLYLPSGIIPMVPRLLSEGRLSLLEGAMREVLSFRVALSSDGEIRSTRIELGAIAVTHRLTYEDADAILADHEHPLHSTLAHLDRLTEARARRRLASGAIQLDLPEVKVRVQHGEVTIAPVLPLRSRSIVAEMMILAGQVAADFCLAEGIPTVFRTQPPPDQPIEVLPGVGPTLELVQQFDIVRTLRRGELRSSPGPHAGLGLSAYVQATSPLRRYADLVVNYQLRRHLLGESPAFDGDSIVTVAARAEDAAQACTAAQRESDRYWLLEYLRRNPEVPLKAVVLHHGGRRPTTPVVLQDIWLKATVGSRGLSPGSVVPVRLVSADPRKDQLRIDLT
jgi:exoribonuclease-2